MNKRTIGVALAAVLPPAISPKAEKIKIDNSLDVEAFRREGGQILHIRPKKFASGQRGVTFAFIHKSSRVTFSTAVQHRDDDFTKKIGTKTALEHFKAGQTVTLPLSNSESAVKALSRIIAFL